MFLLYLLDEIQSYVLQNPPKPEVLSLSLITLCELKGE